MIARLIKRAFDALPGLRNPNERTLVAGSSVFEEQLEEELPNPYAQFDAPLYAFRGLGQKCTVDRSVLARFLVEHPHPLPGMTRYCEANERDRDYRAGAAFCHWCRDRLSVSELVLAGHAVRLVPAK